MWTALIPIIAQYGLPVAEALFQRWSAGTPPTQADFDNLKALAKQSAADVLKAQLVAKGVALDSPQAVALLALVQ